MQNHKLIDHHGSWVIPMGVLQAHLRVLISGLWLCLLLCVEPAAGQTLFVEDAVGRGLIYDTPITAFPAAYGSGVGFADLDGDNDLDVACVGAGNGRIGFFENLGAGFFSDRSLLSGAPSVINLSGVAAADYDGDGDLDLYISNWSGENLLLRNDGNFQFVDVAVAAGVADSGPGAGCCWGDYDGDGWLDLYLVNRTGQFGGPGSSQLPNQLYRNLGNGTFQLQGAAQGVDDPFAGFQGIFFDYDRDNDLDLYLSNDKGQDVGSGNRLWRNEGGNFDNVSTGSGADVRINSMGVAVGDLNRDGFLDLYITNTPEGNPLLLNQADGTFQNLASSWGVASHWLGWGTHFLDLENDGQLDIFVGNWSQRNYVFSCVGSSCTEVGSAVGFLDIAGTLCTAAGDVDQDGDLDLIVQNFGEPLKLFINENSSGHNWTAFRLQGDAPNTQAIGAIVDVRSGSLSQTSTVLSSSGFKTTSTFVQHFGLGSESFVSSVTVTWPNGEQQTWIDLPANQEILLQQTPTMVDCNRNGTDDSLDVLTGSSFDVDGNGVPDECDARFRRGDLDGSGTVNVVDAVRLLEYLFAGRLTLCRDAHDVNDDGSISLPDAVVLLGYVFGSVGAPPFPFSTCGVDPTVDSLTCNPTRGSCP